VKTVLLSEAGTAYTLVDNEPEGVDTATENAFLARTYLEQAGATTARQFVEAQRGSTDTATRRLDDLVKDGWATAERHPGRPTVWTAVPRS
jgi:predicted HTH transcriptional regulator